MKPSITLADLLFIIVVFCAVCSLLYALGLTASYIWIAQGEPDVNGDPERDAGIEPKTKPETHRLDADEAWGGRIPTKQQAPRPWPAPPKPSTKPNPETITTSQFSIHD